MKRLPPIEKIYEALSAVADGRVEFEGDPHHSEGRAHVISSDGNRTYTVEWELNTYSSNDNGTYWQGYPGYPVIAVLMLQGKLQCDKQLAEALKGIDWHDANKRHNNDYRAAVSEILDSRNVPAIVAETAVESAYADLGRLPITVARSGLRPPE